MKFNSKIIQLTVFTSGVLLLLISFFFYNKKVIEAHSESYLNLSDTVKYVGINTCRECHESIYQTFKETGMGKSFDIASLQKSSAVFDKHALVYDKYSNFYYQPFWQGDSLKILEFRLEEKDTIFKRIENIHYIIGSGQHTNSHIYNINGFLYQVPITFYTQTKKWDLAPGFENGHNSRFNRAIGLECMSCHNAHPDFVLGSENKYNNIPKGIDCERCHGPGEIHVKEKRLGNLINISEKIDYTIVNPSKLSIDLQFDVCSRCHIQGNAVLAKDKSFFDFKPGMKLSEVMNVFMPKYKGQENEYIMASHVERLKMSPCFKNTISKLEEGSITVTDKFKPYKDVLTCISCHNPHVSVGITETNTFNNACKNCHSEKYDLCSEDIKKRLEVKDNCVNCHMTKSKTIDIPHVVTTDHYIRKPIGIKEVNKVKEFLGIACINNPHPDSITMANAYINYFEKFTAEPVMLDSARKYLSDKTKRDILKNFSPLIHLYYLKEDYKQIISYVYAMNNVISLNKKTLSNDDAWTNYRIGEAYYQLNQITPAYNYFKKSVQLAPYNIEFKNKLGGTLVSMNKLEEAKQIFEQITKQNPKYAPALSNLGYLSLVTEHNTSKAEALYNQALSIDPDYKQALLNKAGLYIYKKQYSSAREILKRILLKYPDDVQANQMLQNIINNK